METIGIRALIGSAASAVALLSSCASVHMREDFVAPPKFASNAEYGTQVAIGECAFGARPEAAFLAPIATALLSSAISQGVNRIGTALTEAAKEKTHGAKSSRNVEVSSSTFGPCIQVVRGWFHQDPFPMQLKGDPLAGNPKFAAAKGWFSPDFVTEERFRTLWVRNQLWLASPPEFVFEGRFAATGSRSALTIVPQYVRLDEPLFTRALRQDRSRHVAVFFAFHAPDTAVDLATNPGAALIMGKLAPGAARTYSSPDRINELATKDAPLNRWPHESDWFTVTIGKDKEPLIVSALVTEKQDANEFLAFVADVFGGAKETITDQLQSSIVPVKREAARESATADREKAATLLDQKQAGALAVLDTCAQAAAPTPQQASEARSAMRELNQAARGGKVEEPVSQTCLVSIDILADPTSIKSSCDAARKQLMSARKC